jgi:heme oxygenase
MTPLSTGPLSRAIRDGTRCEHQDAENSPFMAALLAGRVDAAGYAAYLGRLRTVYTSIEEVGRAQSADPCVAAVLDPALERLEALETDLAFWCPGPVTVVHSPAAERYALRVRESAGCGGLFVAHHYTRYLGDLSGGQAVARTLAHQFDLERTGKGLAFYAFPGLGRPKRYRDAYRARLDRLGLDVEARGRIVDEAKHAFGLNRALLAELDETATAQARTTRSR